MPWRRAWPPAPVFLPGESHGEEPAGLQSTGSQESDTTEQLTLSLPMGGFDLYAWRDRDGSPAVVLQMVVRYPEANRGAAIF